MKQFGGNVLFLNRSDINTDEIIPAKYLTEITKEALQPHLLEDLILDGFDPEVSLGDVQVIVTRENFGCGSSREHAPWALEVNNINLVLAPNFARIFRQNMYNCGMMAVELEESLIETLFTTFSGSHAQVEVDLKKNVLNFSSPSAQLEVPFSLSDFDRSLVEAGGWVDYADSKY